MLHMSVLKRAKVVHYMLHAKHSSREKKLDKLEKVIGDEEFADCVKLA